MFNQVFNFKFQYLIYSLSIAEFAVIVAGVDYAR